MGLTVPNTSESNLASFQEVRGKKDRWDTYCENGPIKNRVDRPSSKGLVLKTRLVTVEGGSETGFGGMRPTAQCAVQREHAFETH